MPGEADARHAAAELRRVAQQLADVPTEAIGQATAEAFVTARREFARQVGLTDAAQTGVRVRRGRGGRIWIGANPLVESAVSGRRASVVPGARQRRVAVDGQIVPRSFVIDRPGRRPLLLERSAGRTQRVTVPIIETARDVETRTRQVAEAAVAAYADEALAAAISVRSR